MALATGSRLGPYEAASQPARADDVSGSRRFLMVKELTDETGDEAAIVLVQNWLTEVRRLLP